MNKVNYKISTYNSKIRPVLLSAMVLVCTSLVFSIYLSNFIFFNSNAMAIVTNNNTFSSSNIGNSNSSISNIGSGSSNSNINDLPNAKSVYDTGKMVIPSSVKGFLIDIPDEAHHLETDNLMISSANAHYLPSNLVIPSGTSIAFVHGDPNHIHSEIVTASNSNSVAWQTTPIKHPGASDDKILPPGSYSITDAKYTPMKGTITVEPNVKSSGNLVTGAIFVPTPSLVKYKSDFQTAGFQITSTYDFTSGAAKQKDISGPTTLIVYSTTMGIDDAKTKLLPILKSLPYR
jgi:hypothetical protein